MKKKDVTKPQEDSSSEFRPEDFEKKIILDPSALKLTSLEVVEWVEERIHKIWDRINNVDLKERIRILSEEEYTLRSIKLNRKLRNLNNKFDNGFSDMVLEWVTLEKVQAIDELIVLNPKDPKIKTVARKQYSSTQFLTLKKAEQLGDELLELFHRLKQNEFIALSNKSNDFINIFIGKTQKKKCVWIGTQAELKLFLETIQPFLEFEYNIYSRATPLFVDQDSNSFSNLNQPKSKVREIRKKILLKSISSFLKSLEYLK